MRGRCVFFLENRAGEWSTACCCLRELASAFSRLPEPTLLRDKKETRNERAWKKDPNAISSPSTRALTQRYKALGFFIVIGARRDTRRRRLPQKENANVGPRCVFGATRWKKTSHGELSVCTSHTHTERERMKPKPRRRICTIIDVLSFLSFSTSLYYKRNNFHHRVMQ